VLGLFGHGVRGGAVPLAILCGAMLVATACGPVDMILLMTGRSSTNLANTAFALALNVGLNLLLIPRWGMTGAAVAWAVSIAANNLVPLAQVRRSTGMHPFGRGTVAAAFAAVVCVGVPAAVVRLTIGPTVGGLLIALAVGGAAYALVLVRLRGVLRIDGLRAAFAERGRRPAAAESAPSGHLASAPRAGRPDSPTVRRP
jgi:O-antigen/teichoic acid export membrane protein